VSIVKFIRRAAFARLERTWNWTPCCEIILCFVSHPLRKTGFLMGCRNIFTVAISADSTGTMLSRTPPIKVFGRNSDRSGGSIGTQ